MTGTTGAVSTAISASPHQDGRFDASPTNGPDKIQCADEDDSRLPLLTLKQRVTYQCREYVVIDPRKRLAVPEVGCCSTDKANKIFALLLLVLVGLSALGVFLAWKSDLPLDAKWGTMIGVSAAGIGSLALSIYLFQKMAWHDPDVILALREQAAHVGYVALEGQYQEKIFYFLTPEEVRHLFIQEMHAPHSDRPVSRSYLARLWSQGIIDESFRAAAMETSTKPEAFAALQKIPITSRGNRPNGHLIRV